MSHIIPYQTSKIQNLEVSGMSTISEMTPPRLTTEPKIYICLSTKFKVGSKRGSRGAARAAKSLRWSVY